MKKLAGLGTRRVKEKGGSAAECLLSMLQALGPSSSFREGGKQGKEGGREGDREVGRGVGLKGSKISEK